MKRTAGVAIIFGACFVALTFWSSPCSVIGQVRQEMPSRPLVSVLEHAPVERRATLAGNTTNVFHLRQPQNMLNAHAQNAPMLNARWRTPPRVNGESGIHFQSKDDGDQSSIYVASRNGGYVAVAPQESTRSSYRDALYRSMPKDPAGRAARPLDATGNKIQASVDRHSYLESFSNYKNSPWADALVRTTAEGTSWGPTSAVWKSPDIRYQPLYFEQVNLERFGARFPGMQPALSAAHFLATTYQLPTLMLLDPPFKCRFAAGYGRPGNAYCLHRPRGIYGTINSFQAILPRTRR